MSWSRVSFASWSTISFPSMPQWLGTQQKWTQIPLLLNAQRSFMIWQMRGFVSIFAFNRLQARHWVRVDYDIVLYRIHVPIIVQCQCDCCCLSSKYGTVIWESFGQLAASRLTILEMAVDYRCCPHSLVDLRSVSVDFIVWSLSIAILSEFGLSLFSCDHAFADPFNEVMSLRIVFMCSWWEGWCLQGAYRLYVNLCRCHGFLYFETNGFCGGSGHSSFSIWPRKIQISCGWFKIM